ncbi:MAG: DNA/RNA non-specific endonuclease [Clostridium sp.]|nr:DNA/RNA non-specific endonuclease [Prevotella sp.]MCM1429352.1 DNA/RNA non-specific endonuclease [Clostridium sp.]MCM1475613.1 DNA/RNA non-specific endonuclease [Muribaculaceae bacterium]
MKKFLIIAVVVACVAICAQKALNNPEALADNNVAANNGALTSGLHYDNLDMVDIPADIPSYPKSYTGFRLSFNPENHTPNWVGWELLATEIDGPESRSNKFWQDESVRGCPTLADYKNSGYDRGHICPAADQKWSRQAMNDCFVLTNMCPQDGALNRGAWQTLEQKERLWAQRDSAIVIVAGPLYDPVDVKTIGESHVRVPSAFFKAICAPYQSNPRAIAFVYPNMSAPGNMQNYVMTIDDLEKLTGFDFFSALPDDIENKIEAVASFKEWNKQ